MLDRSIPRSFTNDKESVRCAEFSMLLERSGSYPCRSSGLFRAESLLPAHEYHSSDVASRPTIPTPFGL
jgi:hypothetical protein